jgi:hypothetical protein
MKRSLITMKTALLVAVLMLSVAACGGGGSRAAVGQADDAVRWLTKARSTLNAPDSVPTLRGAKVGRSAPRSNLDDLIRTAPKRQTDEVTTALTRLRALAAFDDTVRATAVSIDQSWTTVGDDMYVLSYEAAPSANERATNWLTTMGKQIVRDAACEIAWVQLTSPEQSTIYKLIDEGRSEPANSDSVRGLGKMSHKAAEGAIWEYAQTSFFKVFAPTRVVDWAYYAKGLYTKASDLVDENGTDTITHPDGTITRAFVYYARTCLRPPK